MDSVDRLIDCIASSQISKKKRPVTSNNRLLQMP